MSECEDMTTALARELTQGIEGEVEDLGEVFKRMALLKPKADIIDGEATVVDEKIDTVTDTPFAQSAQITKEPARPKKPIHSSGGLLALARQKPKTPAKKKPAAILEGQMNLFDFFENTA